MRNLLLPIALTANLFAIAQTEVRNASYTFTGGVYPTYSVVFNGTDKAAVEKFFKDQLKPTDVGTDGGPS